MASVFVPPSTLELRDASMGVSPAEPKPTSRLGAQTGVVSHFASWWSFENRLDHVTSYAALALGLAALLAVLVVL